MPAHGHPATEFPLPLLASLAAPSPASGGRNTLQYQAHNTSPPPAPRSRPSALAPPQAPGRDRPDSSLPPAPPAGGLDTLQYPTHKKAPEVARGPLAPLRCSTLRQEPAPSLPYARASRSGSVLRFVALRYGSSPSRPALRYPLMLQRNGG